MLIAATSDQSVTGSIATPTSTVDYEITLAVGDSLIATVGETATAAFDPGISIIRPDGTTLSSDFSELGTLLAANNVTQAGVWKVRVFDGGSNDTGAYRLTVIAVDGTQSPNDGDGGAIASGQRKDGTIQLGDADVYTVAATAGDKIIVSDALLGNDASFQPALFLYGPTGTYINDDASTLGTELTINATTTGTYYLVAADSVNYSVSDRNLGTGTYRMRVAKLPASPQNQDDADGGPITSGQRKDGTIDLGDLDVYTASLSAGDSFMATVAERNGNTAFDPHLRVYGPTGALLTNGDDSSALGTELDFTASASGTYYFVVSDALNYSVGDRAMAAGDYTFRFTKAPGTQSQDDTDGGAITNGQRKDGLIELGDLDTYTIGATAGDHLLVSAVERRGNRAIDPRLRIFGPTGVELFDDSSTLGSEAELTIATTGNYYIVVSDALNYSVSDRAMASGEYTLRALRVPLVPTNDDVDGGTITSGERKTGTLDRGDFDVFSFAADAGDDMLFEAHSITANSADAYVRVYAPNGTVVSSSDGSGLFYAWKFPLTLTGTYLAVVSDSLNFSASDRNFETGDYAVSLALTPATQVIDTDSGSLGSNQPRAGSISLGDVDVYTFNATAGVPFTVNLLDTAASGFDPTLSVFSPTGTTLYDSGDATSRSFTLANPTATGTYVAFVYDLNGDESGAYSIALNTAATTDTYKPSVLRANYRWNDPLPDLRVEFSEPVGASFSIDDFTLKNLTTNVTLDNFSLTTTFDNARDSFVVTFDAFDGRTLPDGNYRLTIPKANITDAAGNPLTSDLNYDFFVLAGDVNHDRHVNFDDLVILAQNYNGLDRSAGEGNVNYSTEGETNFDDLIILAQKYNTTLAPPPALLTPAAVATVSFKTKKASVWSDLEVG